MDPQVGQPLDGLSFSLCSTFCLCISFRQEQFWVNILEMGGWVAPSLNWGAMPNLWIWSRQVLLREGIFNSTNVLRCVLRS